MEVRKMKINEVRGIIQFGTATIHNIEVEFCYNSKTDKFTAIAYDEQKASGVFDEGGKDTPQEYLVGRAISRSLKLRIN